MTFIGLFVLKLVHWIGGRRNTACDGVGQDFLPNTRRKEPPSEISQRVSRRSMIIWEELLLAKKPPIFTSVTSTGGVGLFINGSVISLALLQVSLSTIMIRLRRNKPVQRGRRSTGFVGAVGLILPMKHPRLSMLPTQAIQYEVEHRFDTTHCQW